MDAVVAVIETTPPAVIPIAFVSEAEPILPASAIVRFPPDNTTVPVASGNVIVRSPVGSVIANVVSCPSAEAPSNTRGLAPCNVAPIVSVSAAASPRTRLPFKVVTPVTVTF